MKDIVIIGAGPAGISMAVESENAGISAENILILEKADEHSFTIKKYYPDNKLVTANYKGFAAACTGVMCLADSSKNETISYLDKAIETHKLNVHYQENVYKIHQEKSEQKFFIYTDKNVYEAKVVVIAVGPGVIVNVADTVNVQPKLLVSVITGVPAPKPVTVCPDIAPRLLAKLEIV